MNSAQRGDEATPSPANPAPPARAETGGAAEVAWLPLTPRGVAAFAFATTGRLLLVQALAALLASGVVVWFLAQAWFPGIAGAIQALPATGEIRAGSLHWPAHRPRLLMETRFLGLAVDLEHTGQSRSAADVSVEFGAEDWRIYSLFGYVELAYPTGCTIAFNERDLRPWWGAWSPALLAGVGLATLAGLLLVWAFLAAVYAPAVWGMAFFLDRPLGWRASWRLAGAALMPGAAFLTIAILMYGLHGLGLPQLLLAFGIHWLIGWLYLPLAPLFIVRASRPPKNPFAAAAR